MSNMVLDMPVMTTPALVVSPKREVLQARLKTVHDGQFAALKQQYLIPDEGRVFAFLHQHSWLIGVLQEGREAVTAIFGEGTRVKLHMQYDPEVGAECLLAWIQTSLPASEAVDLMLELDDTWFIDRQDIVGELLLFTLGAS